MPRHYRVTLRDVLEAHDQALGFGGLQGVRSLHLIKSAIARPYSGYHRAFPRKCAALTHSLAMNHGFVDGNKRTTLLSVTLLVSRSGYHLVARGDDINEEIEQLILDVVENRLVFEDIAEWFKRRLTRS